MNNLKRYFQENLWIWGILFISLIARIYTYRVQNPLWDASVYVLMGKYIFSQGAVGLWEAFRPVLWPVMLGLLWKMGLDPIVWGSVLQVLFSMGSIYLVYAIGKLVFNKRTGLLTALFLSFSPIFYVWGDCLFSRIPATFLCLLSLYLILTKRNLFLSGFILGCAVLTNFMIALVFMVILAVHIIYLQGKENISGNRKLMFGFALPIAVFLVFNGLKYGDILYPFVLLTKSTSQYFLLWDKGASFFIRHFVVKENILILFYLPGLFLIAKRGFKKNRDKIIIAAVGVLLFVFVNLVKSKEARYLIVALPYLYMVSAFAIVEVYGYLKKTKRNWINALFTPLILFMIFQWSHIRYLRFPSTMAIPNAFQGYIKNNERGIKGNIWISNPTTLVYSNLRADELIYYPVFDTHRALELQRKLDSADWIFLDQRDFLCAFGDYSVCSEEKNKLMEKIISGLYPLLRVNNPQGQMVGGIFKKRL